MLVDPLNANDGQGNIAGTFLPTQLGNLVLWLRADQGVTLSNASLSNNTLATWAAGNLTSRVVSTDPNGGTGAVMLTDTVDGGPLTHGISRVPTNSVTGPALDDVWLQPGTKTWARWTDSNAGNWVYLDLVNGVTGTSSDNVTATVLQTVGTWKRWRIKAAGTGANPCDNLTRIIWMAGADGGASYQGVGTGTIFVGTGATFGPVMTQNRVSAWADQSGNGNNATQGVAGNQPLLRCFDTAGNWVPFPGSMCEIGWPIDTAGKQMAFGTSVSNLWNGANIPMTVLVLAQCPGAISVVAETFSIAGAGPQYSLIRQRVPYGVFMSDGAATLNALWSGSPSATYKVVAASYDGASVSLWQNEVADASNPQAIAMGNAVMSSANINWRDYVEHEIAVYSRVLTATERKLAANGMLARWQLPLIP